MELLVPKPRIPSRRSENKSRSAWQKDTANLRVNFICNVGLPVKQNNLRNYLAKPKSIS